MQFSKVLFELVLSTILFTVRASDVMLSTTSSPQLDQHCQVRGHCSLPEGFVYLEDYYHAHIATKQSQKSFETDVPESVTHKIRECLRYATKENFSGQIVLGYGNGSRAVATVATAEALYKAQKLANERGYSLIVYDSYRPKKVILTSNKVKNLVYSLISSLPLYLI